jgi:hypothetical protein
MASSWDPFPSHKRPCTAFAWASVLLVETITMNVVSKELGRLTRSRLFREFHDGLGPAFNSDIVRFLEATTDEVRTITSSRVVESILEEIGLSDAMQFREAVLRRELYGNIAYPGQRDHSAHTLNNYLLGWYFFVYCVDIRKSLIKHFKIRGLGSLDLYPFGHYATYFGCVWQFASLLHDIGYMFEGSRARGEFEVSSRQVEIGVRVAKEYFSRAIWIENGIELNIEKDLLFGQLGGDLRPPRFENVTSLGDIANELTTIGNLHRLSNSVASVLKEYRGVDKRSPRYSDRKIGGFDVWTHHYERFGMRKMAKRISSTRKIFNALIDKGFPGSNICLLDHGVSGALLQLSASTYYYRLRAAAESCTPPLLAQTQRVKDVGPWSPAFWWTAIVWGTGAVSVHNIQQLESARKLDARWPGTLTLDEDPLAFLGVIVDIIQEWDRYSVFKKLDREPIQGTEVKLGHSAGKILVEFGEPHSRSRAKKLRKNLRVALRDWAKFLEVRP